jgi:PAP2 superfamily
MNANGRLRVATVLLLLLGPAPARADTVTDWNGHATDALIVTARQPPGVSAIHLAMVHGAVYDAVNAIDGRYEPYLAAPPAQRWYSKRAATAAAAHRVLAALLPAQREHLVVLYAASLARVAPGPARDGGIAVGDATAEAMLAARADDERFGPFRFPVGSSPGRWRPVPPALINDPFAWVARVRPFMMRSTSQFRSQGPQPLAGVRYARELAEVKSLGSLTSSTRTSEQTEIARFWADDGVAMWSRIARQLASRHVRGTADAARLYAMVYLTAADAGIGCWDDKAHWSFWRPITAIREAGADGNLATRPDPDWQPLLPTPPFPEHPSAHGCGSGAIAWTLRDFFDTDRVEFSAHSPVSGTTRHFTRLSRAIGEIIDARVYAGLHFRTADDQGARLGRHVARWRRHHYFRKSPPVAPLNEARYRRAPAHHR